MGSTDARIDAYIEKAKPFAQPILEYIRASVHEACPEVAEDWKWSYPHFMYKGKILSAMCAFKKHCAMGFWLEQEMKTVKEYTANREKNGMFTLGKIEKIEDLPSKPKLIAAIKEAMELTDMGVTLKRAAPAKEAPKIPDYFEQALKEKGNAWASSKKVHHHLKKKISSGLRMPKPKPPETAAWSRLWNGFRKVRDEIGSTKNAENEIFSRHIDVCILHGLFSAECRIPKGERFL